jgi:ligand-binding sensor domain-containing protein
VKIYFTYICLLFLLPVASQEYNYVHYDTKDGLAGSTVYRICQDKKGYLWFATDNGVSMFDGKKFRNFTTENGLTDNDILFIEPDSKGRVWMSPFNKTICYYYNGKIYNSSNDPVLKNSRFSSNLVMAGENPAGDVFLYTNETVFKYTRTGELKRIADYNELARPYSLNPSKFMFMNEFLKHPPYHAVLINGTSVFTEKNDSFVFTGKINIDTSRIYKIFRITEKMEVSYFDWMPENTFTSISILGNGELAYNTMNGSWFIDSMGKFNLNPFLPGKKITCALKDNEGNVWFSTIGEGVYRLSSMSIKTFSGNQEAFCLEKSKDRIYAGSADGSLKEIKNLHLEKEISFPPDPKRKLIRRLYTLKADNYGNLFLGFDAYLIRFNEKQRAISMVNPIKSIDIIDGNSILVSTNSHILKLRSHDLKILDTVWRERGTKVVYDKGFYYIGTLNGLIVIDTADKTATRAGQNNPLLNKRIVDICKMPDGSLWIATNDNGVLLYRNGYAETVINAQNGLSSNICKSVFVKDNYLWVGTNKGLSKIDTRTKKVVIRYSTSEGLASDIINAIYAEDSIIWVCSPAGVTYFNEKDIAGSSVAILDIAAIRVSGNEVDPGSNLQLSYKNNNISFEYTTISFKSAGEIVYHYKLTGLDNDWKQTALTTLSYPTLPPGDYEFQLYAVNKFGQRSDTIFIPFSIATPFWKTIWFWAVIGLFAIGAIWFLLNLRYKRMQERMKEKNELLQRMTELEQASLRAQMNPHFIFNCLNSIQYFILKGKINESNKYIAQFGSLIRQTLDNSARANITIADEMNYLTSYMELEKMRFPSSFDYEICIDSNIRTDYTYIPSMLLQPFVENALRHGIRYKQEGTGTVKIEVRETNHEVLFSIEDNGIGREAAARYKSEQHIEYQSKGIMLTQRRVAILNANNTEKINTTIIDLKDEKGIPSGTKVLLSFPLPVIDKLQ